MATDAFANKPTDIAQLNITPSHASACKRVTTVLFFLFKFNRCMPHAAQKLNKGKIGKRNRNSLCPKNEYAKTKKDAIANAGRHRLSYINPYILNGYAINNILGNAEYAYHKNGLVPYC